MLKYMDERIIFAEFTSRSELNNLAAVLKDQVTII